MEKCWVRVDRPFFDPNGTDSKYYAPFHREVADAEEYLEPEEEFDFKNLRNINFDVA